jgi:hypothetical protein
MKHKSNLIALARILLITFCLKTVELRKINLNDNYDKKFPTSKFQFFTEEGNFLKYLFFL